MTLLKVERLTVRLGGRAVVDGVDLSLDEGEVLALLGPSGCGKSTTLRALAGLQRADGGGVTLAGTSLTDPYVPPERRGVGLVFQDGAVFPHLSVAENILFGLKVRRVPSAERKQRLQRTAELLGLSELLGRRPSQLSGGQQQRVALGHVPHVISICSTERTIRPYTAGPFLMQRLTVASYVFREPCRMSAGWVRT